jgi:hypothetical protein
VAGIEEGKLILKDERGRETAFNPEGLGGSFEVFEKQELALATGDWVQITKNGYDLGRKHRLLNGNRRTMEGFTQKGDLKLEGGIVVPANYGHLDHGYSPTSYSAQSKTVDRVFIAESTDSLLAANREQIYVSVSRGRITPRLFTDNLEALIDAAHETSHRVSAMDMMNAELELSGPGEKVRPAKEALGQLPEAEPLKGLPEQFEAIWENEIEMEAPAEESNLKEFLGEVQEAGQMPEELQEALEERQAEGLEEEIPAQDKPEAEEETLSDEEHQRLQESLGQYPNVDPLLNLPEVANELESTLNSEREFYELSNDDPSPSLPENEGYSTFGEEMEPER